LVRVPGLEPGTTEV